jgi:hypothetical protein
MAFCGNCGTQLNDGAKFCPKCGQTVGGGSSVPQQQVNQSQQQFADEQEETMKLWQKILYVLVGPAGLLAGLVYTIRKKASMAKSAFLWGAIGTVLWIAMANMGSSSEPENTTKQIMVEEFKKQGSNLVIKDLTLVHKSGNEYSGIAECTVDGDAAQYAVKVIYDGNKVQAEWELSAIRDDASDDEEEESGVSSSQASDIAEAGYKAGYEMGFDMADIDMEPDAKQSFSMLYGAPSTQEEKQMFNIYKENYERGYREGRRAGRE